MKLNFLVMYQPPFVASILTFALPSVKRFLLGASLLKYSLNFCLSDLQNTICRALFKCFSLYSFLQKQSLAPWATDSEELSHWRLTSRSKWLCGLWQVAHFYDTMSDHRFDMNAALIFPSNQISCNTRRIITQKRCIHFVQTTCSF